MTTAFTLRLRPSRLIAQLTPDDDAKTGHKLRQLLAKTLQGILRNTCNQRRYLVFSAVTKYDLNVGSGCYWRASFKPGLRLKS